MTGITFTINTGNTLNYNSSPVIIQNISYSTPTDILTIHDNNGNILLKISNNNEKSEILYRFNEELVNVNMPEELIDAFVYTVLGLTGMNYDDALINKYFEKIENSKFSNDYLNKLEMIFRKRKLKKLKLL